MGFSIGGGRITENFQFHLEHVKLNCQKNRRVDDKKAWSYIKLWKIIQYFIKISEFIELERSEVENFLRKTD